MTKTRVLIVDDSVVIRRLLSDILADDPDVEIAGVAANGEIALQKLDLVQPDVVTLDVEMPGMDGVETLRHIRKRAPHLPVIMFSTLTDRAARITLEALAAGATDYACKPSGMKDREAARAHVQRELLAKVKQLARPALARATGPAPKPRAVPRPRAAPAPVPHVIAIGSSTGGPAALSTVLRGLGKPSVPVLVTQHMPQPFTKLLADRLNSSCALDVREAEDGMLLTPGQALIAPGDWHLGLSRDGAAVRVKLNQGPPENSCRPAVDVMFRDVATQFRDRALGIILTGMGQDGLRGVEALLAAGSRAIVQDEATSVVWGMPGIVARQGLADAVLPVDGIAAAALDRLSPRPPTPTQGHHNGIGLA